MNYYDPQQNNLYDRNSFNQNMNNGSWFNTRPIVQEPPIIVIPVTGEQAARSYPIEKGRTVLLIDFENHRFWIKSIKPNGLESSCEGHSFISDSEANSRMNQQQMTPQLNVTEEFQNKFVSREEFDALKKTIEDFMK